MYFKQAIDFAITDLGCLNRLKSYPFYLRYLFHDVLHLKREADESRKQMVLMMRTASDW